MRNNRINVAVIERTLHYEWGEPYSEYCYVRNMRCSNHPWFGEFIDYDIVYRFSSESAAINYAEKHSLPIIDMHTGFDTRRYYPKYDDRYDTDYFKFLFSNN